MIDHLRLYLVADPDHCPGSLVVAVRAALEGGVGTVQLRAKHLSDRETTTLGRKLRELTIEHGALFLVNDRIDLAFATGADGVHLGVTDLHPDDARRIAPPEFVIGYSPEDADDRDGAHSADYYGIGPVFGTRSKADAGEALELDAFAARVKRSPVPVIGIGGIDEGNAGEVIAQGTVGVAVISAILGALDPREAARQIRRAIDDDEMPEIVSRN